MLKPICLLSIILFGLNEFELSAQSVLNGCFIVGGFSGSSSNQLNAVVRSGQTTSFNQSETQGLRFDVGIGRFYKQRKAYELGFWTSLSHNKTSSSNYWNNSYGVNIGKITFMPVVDSKLWFTLGQRVEYFYNMYRDYSKNASLPRPQNEQRNLGYVFSPGMYFSLNKHWMMALQLPLINVGVNEYQDNRGSKRTIYNYNVNANLTLANVQFRVLYKFNQSNTKTGL